MDGDVTHDRLVQAQESVRQCAAEVAVLEGALARASAALAEAEVELIEAKNATIRREAVRQKPHENERGYDSGAD